MPTFYKRKEGVKPRGQWDPERLKEAINRIQQGDISMREAERYYGVPARTIKRRMEKGNTDAPGHGPKCSLGPENEERLVKHIHRLCDAGFCPDQTAVRQLAYEFALALKVPHRFNNEKKIAGYDWLWSFLRRHPELSIRKAEGLSMARGRGLTREAAQNFYDLLEEEIRKHELQDKPQNIFNVDESGVQLINKVGKVIARKGAKVVCKITTAEKGETVSMVACCSAEGRFLPPALIFKGKNLKLEFQDGLPPGSSVYMNPQSAYISSEIFYTWFKRDFLPRKATGRNILILDGHCSHVSSIALLELADQSDVTLLCLPPHTTHALQPLDKSFFGPFKTYFKSVSNTWVEQHIGRKLTRYQVGPLICDAWNKAASVGNGTNGFKVTGIYPFNRNALPDHLFSVSDNVMGLPEESTQMSQTPPRKTITTPQTNLQHTEPLPGTSYVESDAPTPSKYLHKISPIPRLCEVKAKGRSKKGATVLTSEENRAQLKENLKKKLLNNTKKNSNNGTLTKRRMQSFESDRESESSSSEVDKVFIGEKYSNHKCGKKKLKNTKTKKTCQEKNEKSNPGSGALDFCKECTENYYTTKRQCDWLRCAMCQMWVHEDCTIFDSFCIDCGRKNKSAIK